MSETIPLCPALRVQFVFIIICNALGQCLDLVLEAFTGETRNFRMVQG